MARAASIGEMRTRVVVRTIQTDTDADGFTVRKYQDIFPEPIWCKWVWAHGAEALENMRQKMTQTATLTEKMDKVDSRLVSIEERPGEEYRYYRRMIIGCLITGVIGAALGALSSLLFT